MRIAGILGWLTVIVHIVVVFLAIRLYRRKRTLAFGFLLASCISFVVADNSLSLFGFLSGFLRQEAGSQEVFAFQYWGEYIGFIFTWLFVLSLLGALVVFLRTHGGEHHANRLTNR